jgi:lipopolysaccharide transport system ATP-binding protein
MSDSVIRVENLSKKYVIGHQKQERYTALRDVIADKVRGIGNIFNRHAQGRDEAFEEFWALKDVSFEIKQGDRVGIIGRNGAGKSTLLKVLSRITEPTSGRISIKGRVASLLEVGTGFHPELTGRENIYLNGAILGMDRYEIKKKFDEIVDFAEVEKFLDTPVKRYSSGMYVRLAFAVAAHLESEILIVDEVLAVGDIAFQRKCLNKMKDITKIDNKTILFVSHNMEAIRRLCSSAILLRKGTLSLQGKLDSIITIYDQNSNEEDKNIGGKYSQAFRIRESLQDFIQFDGFWIEKIELTHLDGRSIDKFAIADSLRIKINYLSNKLLVSSSLIVTCKSPDGTKIFELHSSPRKDNSSDNIEAGKGAILLEIPRLPVLGGTYYFDISLARIAVEKYFTIPQAIELIVEPTDIYECGFTFDQKNGLIYLEHYWSVER